MAIITLSFSASEDQVVSGIPKTVEISTNIAATIYYTLDGSLPTLFSSVYVDSVSLPTNQNSITLSAIAYFTDENDNLVPSSVLSQVYSTDQSDLDRTRWINFEGVVYSYPGGLDIPFYYDVDGEVSVSIDVPVADLLLVASDRDHQGTFVGTDTAVGTTDPDQTATLVDNDRPEYASPNETTFNPEAAFIQIDGRSTADDQVVELINGPYMSLRDLKTSYGGIEFYNTAGTNYISGDAVRHHYDRQRNIIVFYYLDSNTNRWVKSIQDLDDATQIGSTPNIQNPLIFQWMEFGRHQST